MGDNSSSQRPSDVREEAIIKSYLHLKKNTTASAKLLRDRVPAAPRSSAQVGVQNSAPRGRSVLQFGGPWALSIGPIVGFYQLESFFRAGTWGLF